jgi:hypothetical protein
MLAGTSECGQSTVRIGTRRTLGDGDVAKEFNERIT